MLRLCYIAFIGWVCRISILLADGESVYTYTVFIIFGTGSFRQSVVISRGKFLLRGLAEGVSIFPDDSAPASNIMLQDLFCISQNEIIFDKNHFSSSNGLKKNYYIKKEKSKKYLSLRRFSNKFLQSIEHNILLLFRFINHGICVESPP